MGLLALLHQTQFAKEHLLAPLAARRGRPRASPRAAPGQFRSGPHKKNSQAGKRGSGEEGSTWGRAARGSGRAFSQIGAAPESRAGGRARPRRSSAAHPAAPGARHAGRRAPRFAPPRTTEGNSAVPREGKKPASYAAAKAPSIPRGARPVPLPPPPLRAESPPPQPFRQSARSEQSLPLRFAAFRAGRGPGRAPPSEPGGPRSAGASPSPDARQEQPRPPAPSTHLQLPALCRRTAGPRRAAFPRRPALSVGRPSPFAPPPEARGTPPARGCCGARRSPSGFAPCPKQRGARVSGIGSGTGGLTQPTVIDRRGDLLRRRSKPIVLLKCKGTFSPSRVLCTHTYRGYTSQVRCFRALLLPALPSPAPPRSRRQGLQLGSSLPMLSALTNRTFPAGSRQLGLEIKIGN